MATIRAHTLSTGAQIKFWDRTAETASISETMRGFRIFADPDHPNRPLSGIDQIVLHHTGSGFEDQPNSRYDHVMAHWAVRRNGDILQLRSHAARLQASTHTNRAIDIEFEGDHVGAMHFRRILNHIVRDLPESEWVSAFEDQLDIDLDDTLVEVLLDQHAASPTGGPRMHVARPLPTLVQLQRGRLLVRYLKETVGTINHIYSHQQVYTHGPRANCPGPHLWYNIGKWAKETLGLRNDGAIRAIPVTGRGIIGWEDPRFRLI